MNRKTNWQLKLFIPITFLTFIAFIGEAFALDVTAGSCSESAVEAAIAQVEDAGGGTVFIPEGDCTWDGTVYIKSPMNIVGAGYDKTILRKSSGQFFNHTSAGNSVYTGLGFVGGGPDATITSKGIYLASGINFRIYNNKFYRSKWHGVLTFKSCVKGVVYNNIFERVTEGTSNYGIQLGSNYVNNPGVCDYNDPNCYTKWDTWWDDGSTNNGMGYPENFDAGSDMAIFIEDNTFTWAGPAVEGNWGSKQSFVFRYNTVYGQTSSSQASVKPGAIWAEIYKNHFEYIGPNAATNPPGKISYFRCSGLLYDNTMINFKYGGNLAAYYCGFGYCYTQQVLMDEAYIFNNIYQNVSCGEDKSDCWAEWSEGAPERITEGENYFFRAPQQGDRIYPYAPYTYPHPARSEGLPTPVPPPPVPAPDPGGSDTTPKNLRFVAANSVLCGQYGDKTGEIWYQPCAIESQSSSGAEQLIDNNTDTVWNVWQTKAHWAVIDLGDTYNVSGLRKYHTQYAADNSIAGIYVTNNTSNWGSAVGSMPEYRNEKSGWKTTSVTAKAGRYVKIVSNVVHTPAWSEIQVKVSN